MANLPLRVYLDSSDYSVMSDPRQRDQSAGATLSDLRRWVQAKTVTCHFSGTLLCEIAPLGSGATGAAQRRADLVAELCGRNALVSQERLYDLELSTALGLESSVGSVHSTSGDWFPVGSEQFSPVNLFDVGSDIKKMIGESAPNRAERRRRERALLKGGRPRRATHDAVLQSARTGALNEVLEQLPMRQEDARVLARYVVGDASAEEATTAFQESLRDPRWMLQWFASRPETMTPFVEWVRGPAEKLMPSVEAMISVAERMRNLDREVGANFGVTTLSLRRWSKWQDELLLSVCRSIAEKLLRLDGSSLSTAAIDRSCPGLSVGIRSLHSAWRQSTIDSPRMPMKSDLPDALHAMYAPYVDLFRADSFMAPFIASCARGRQTRVISKLRDLVPAIRAELEGKDRA